MAYPLAELLPLERFFSLSAACTAAVRAANSAISIAVFVIAISFKNSASIFENCVIYQIVNSDPASRQSSSWIGGPATDLFCSASFRTLSNHIAEGPLQGGVRAQYKGAQVLVIFVHLSYTQDATITINEAGGGQKDCISGAHPA